MRAASTTTQSDANRCFRSLTNSAKFAGIFAGSMRGVRSLPVVEEATGPSLWDGVRSAFDPQT